MKSLKGTKFTFHHVSPPHSNMKIVPTGLHNLLLFNLPFFINENVEIGFATTILLQKLLNESL